jgi:hypothetical protein
LCDFLREASGEGKKPKTFKLESEMQNSQQTSSCQASSRNGRLLNGNIPVGDGNNNDGGAVAKTLVNDAGTRLRKTCRAASCETSAVYPDDNGDVVALLGIGRGPDVDVEAVYGNIAGNMTMGESDEMV